MFYWIQQTFKVVFSDILKGCDKTIADTNHTPEGYHTKYKFIYDFIANSNVY